MAERAECRQIPETVINMQNLATDVFIGNSVTKIESKDIRNILQAITQIRFTKIQSTNPEITRTDSRQRS